MSRVVLYLIGYKGYKVIDSIVGANFLEHIEHVVVNRDQGVQNDHYDDIRNVCRGAAIKCIDRAKANKEARKPQTIGLAIGWKWLISNQDHLQLIIIHDSLLPKYRGFAPLVSQLINGESKIGATAILASREFDRGNIIFQEFVEIAYPIKVNEAIDLITSVYQTLALRILESLSRSQGLPSMVQNEEEATYSVWRDEEDLRIDWTLPSERLKRFIDATGYPYNGPHTFLDDQKVVIDDVELVDDVKFEDRHCGKTIFMENGKPVVICGTGLLRIENAKWASSGETIDNWPKYRMRFK